MIGFRFLNLWLEGKVLRFFLLVLHLFQHEFLLCRGVAHVVGEKLLPVVLGYHFRNFVDFRLKRILLVDLLLQELPLSFPLLRVSLEKPLILLRRVLVSSLGVALANDLRGEVNLGFECALSLLSEFVCRLLTLLFLLE